MRWPRGLARNPPAPPPQRAEHRVPKPHVLSSGNTSPFGPMTRVVGLELGIPVDECQIDVYTAAFLDALNPLRQIPTLQTESGEVLTAA